MLFDQVWGVSRLEAGTSRGPVGMPRIEDPHMTVESLVGEYPAYVRILPPVTVVVVGTTESRSSRWDQLLGTQPEPGQLNVAVGQLREQMAVAGQELLVCEDDLDVGTLTRLVAHLGPATTTRERCFFRFWSGRLPGWTDESPEDPTWIGPIDALSRFVVEHVPGRLVRRDSPEASQAVQDLGFASWEDMDAAMQRMSLPGSSVLGQSMDGVLLGGQLGGRFTPNSTVPEDLSWHLAIPIDGNAAYLGCAPELAASLTDDPEVESLQIAGSVSFDVECARR